jgi:hypothetical protein
MNIKSAILNSLSDIGANYLESKSKTLERLSELEAMEWAMINLDGVRQQRMCKTMGVNFLDWRNAARIVRRVRAQYQIDEKRTPKEIALILSWQNDESVHVTQNLDDESLMQVATQIQSAKEYQLWRLDFSAEKKAQIALEIQALNDEIAAFGVRL